jgi:hypothetical protein
MNPMENEAVISAALNAFPGQSNHRFRQVFFFEPE